VATSEALLGAFMAVFCAVLVMVFLSWLVD